MKPPDHGIHYQPVKESLDRFVSRSVRLKGLFFRLLDLYLLRTWHIHRELRKFLREAGSRPRILDAGCGLGQYSWYLARKCPRAQIAAVDINEACIRSASRFFLQAGYANVECRTADLVTYRQSELFDLVLAIDVMEHIADDDQVFRNFHQSLAPGGVLLISTPSDKGGSGVPRGEEGTSFIREHVRNGYSLEEMKRKLAGSGFDRVEARYTYGTPGGISWILLMKLPLRLLNRSKAFFVFLPLYLMVVYPVCFILNWLDLTLTHAEGTGLIVKAFK